MSQEKFPQIYTVKSNVNIRREPRKVDTPETNIVGKLTAGTHRLVYETLSDKYGGKWGRVSDAGADGIAQWICLSDINRTYAAPVPTAPASDNSVALSGIKAQLDTIEQLLRQLVDRENK